MAVTLDAGTNSTPGQVGSHNFNHTPSGTPTTAILYAYLRGGPSADTEITGVTYGGDAMSLLAERVANGTDPPTSSWWVSIYGISGPKSGLQNVAITITGDNVRRSRYRAETYVGSLTSGAFGTAQVSSGSGTSTTDITLSSETDGLCVDALMVSLIEEDLSVDDASQTEILDANLTGGTLAGRAGLSHEDGAASVTMGWSWTTSDGWAHVGVPIIPAETFTTAVISEGTGTDDENVLIDVDTHDDTNTDHSDLYRHTSSPASGGSNIQNDITPTQSSTITDNDANSTTGPDPDTTYYYMLRDYTDAGELDPHDSNEISILTAPARPTTLTLIESRIADIRFGWTDQTADTYKHRVYYRLKGNSTWILATPTGVAAGTDEYTVTGLAPGVWEFHVRAWNDGQGIESGFDQILEAATATELRAFQCDAFQYDTFQVREPSYVHPSADVAIGNWEDELAGTTNIYQSIDEDPAVDSDYVMTLVVATDDIYRFRLEPVGDRPCDQGFVLQYRIEKEAAGTVRMVFDIIKEDLSVVATQTHASVPDAVTEYEIALTSTQVATLKAANWFASPLVQVTADNGT